jgi:hypothetical protein
MALLTLALALLVLLAWARPAAAPAAGTSLGEAVGPTGRLAGPGPGTSASALPDEEKEIEEEEAEEEAEEREDGTPGCEDPEGAGQEFQEEGGEGEGSEGEGGAGKGEACEAGADRGRLPPRECGLRSARASALVLGVRGQVRLVVHYTSFAPANAVVGYRLAGPRGGLRVRAHRRYLSRRGVLRLSDRLDAAAARKALAARRFTVTLRVPAAPGYCRRYEVRHLTIRHEARNQVSWAQSESAFGVRR